MSDNEWAASIVKPAEKTEDSTVENRLTENLRLARKCEMDIRNAESEIARISSKIEKLVAKKQEHWKAFHAALNLIIGEHDTGRK